MEITEAIEICRLQEFWQQVIDEYSLTHPSPRRQQELWVILRSKLMAELLNIGEPVPKLLKRFQHLTKNTLKNSRKPNFITTMIQTPLHRIVEKKLDAISTIYSAFITISE